MLFARDPDESSFESCFETALSDPDPRVVAFGIQQARRRRGPATARVLAECLDGALGGATSPSLQIQAVEELAEAGSREARDVLIEALARRRLALGAGSRAVAREMALTLERIGDEDALAALRRWRRSAAGLWSRILDPRGSS
jgi:HEAT repeat protein